MLAFWETFGIETPFGFCGECSGRVFYGYADIWNGLVVGIQHGAKNGQGNADGFDYFAAVEVVVIQFWFCVLDDSYGEVEFLRGINVSVHNMIEMEVLKGVNTIILVVFDAFFVSLHCTKNYSNGRQNQQK